MVSWYITVRKIIIQDTKNSLLYNLPACNKLFHKKQHLKIIGSGKKFIVFLSEFQKQY